MLSFTNFVYTIKEELNAAQKDYVDEWSNKHKWLDPLFGSKDRITIPFGIEHDVDNQTKHSIIAALTGNEMIKSTYGDRGKDVNYRKGYAKDIHGRDVSIGKLLTALIGRFEKESKPDHPKHDINKAAKTNTYDGRTHYQIDITRYEKMLNDFNNDPERKAAQKKKEIVITRDPYDVAGMSTDRGWRSCMAMPSTPGPGERSPSGHTLWNRLADDLHGGTIVAYLVNQGDDEIKNPTARIALKPYEQEDTGTMALLPQKAYGTAPPEFDAAVSDHIKKFLKLIDTGDTRNKGWVNQGGYIDNGYDNNPAPTHGEEPEEEEDDEAAQEAAYEAAYEAASEEVYDMDDSNLADAVDWGEQGDHGINYGEMATRRVVDMIEYGNGPARGQDIKDYPDSLMAALLGGDSEAWYGKTGLEIELPADDDDDEDEDHEGDVITAVKRNTNSLFDRVVDNVILSSEAIDKLWSIPAPLTNQFISWRRQNPETVVFNRKGSLLGNSGVQPINLERALLDIDVKVRLIAATHEKADSNVITKALKDRDKYIRLAALKHANAEKRHYELAMKDDHFEVRGQAENLLAKHNKGPTLMGFKTFVAPQAKPVQVATHTRDGVKIKGHTRELPNMPSQTQNAPPNAANIRKWQYRELLHRNRLGQEYQGIGPLPRVTRR